MENTSRRRRVGWKRLEHYVNLSTNFEKANLFLTKGNKMKLTSKKHGGIEVDVKYGFHHNLDEAIQAFGADVVLSRFNRSLNTEFRLHVMRQVENDAAKGAKKVKKGDTPHVASPQRVATEAAASFKPTLTSGLTRVANKVDKLMESLSEEDKAAFRKAMAAQV